MASKKNYGDIYSILQKGYKSIRLENFIKAKLTPICQDIQDKMILFDSAEDFWTTCTEEERKHILNCGFCFFMYANFPKTEDIEKKLMEIEEEIKEEIDESIKLEPYSDIFEGENMLPTWLPNKLKLEAQVGFMGAIKKAHEAKILDWKRIDAKNKDLDENLIEEARFVSSNGGELFF